jgi:hypothetical protein
MMDYIDEHGNYHQFKQLCHCSHGPHCGQACTTEGCNCKECQCINCDHPNVIKSIS